MKFFFLTTENMQDGGADLSSVTNSTATSPSSGFSGTTSSRSTKPIIRKTVSQKQKITVHKKIENRKYSYALKDATRRLAMEWDKKNSKDICSPIKGARVIAKQVNDCHGTKLNYRTVTRYVSAGMIGVSPKRRGPEGNVPEKILKLLASATESYIRINQGNGNGDVIKRKSLARTVNSVADPFFEESTRRDKLLVRILDNTDLNLSAGIQESVEDRRLRWTTYSNLKLWFDSWAEDIVDLGFGYIDADGNIEIPIDQLARILNLDESCLSLDGSKERRGGRPSSSLFDPNLMSNCSALKTWKLLETLVSLAQLLISRIGTKSCM